MGNREALLSGARRCILEKGYARTTARDIASAAGVSLAAIGYHFGSKEHLLAEALTEALGEGLGDALDAVLRRAGTGRDAADAFGATWDAAPGIFEAQRETILASLENILNIQRSGAGADIMAQATERAVSDLGTILGELNPGLGHDELRALSALYFALLNGLAMMWLADPASVPSGAELTRAVRALAG